MTLTRFFLTISILFFSSQLMAQYLVSGTIADEQGVSIPYAKVYVKNSADLRTMADANGHYEMWLYEGEYYLVITSNGYDLLESYVMVTGEGPVEKNFQLLPTKIQDIENVEVSAKKTNPGREIILKVIERRDQMNPWNYPHTVEGYIKATEKIDRKEKNKNARRKKKLVNTTETADPEGIEDPFAEQRKLNDAIASNMNLVEVNFTRHYGGRNQVKEIRNGYEKRGNKNTNLYYTTTVKSNFNFFENLLHLDDLHQTPVSSPISTPGILYYKYRLEKQYMEDGMKIHKIKIIPRLMSSTTLEGYIYVVDSTWLIQKLELKMEKGNLHIYDYFSIYQEFEHQGDTLCILKRQTLDYGVKYKNESSACATVAEFYDYNFSPNFAPKFFNNEVAVTEQEAYDQDSTFWAEERKAELTPEEIEYITIKDSIEEYHKRKEYLDSIDADFNKVTALKVLWFGIDHRNRTKKTQWTLSSLAGMFRPIFIAGPRIAPNFSYFKKWENERTLDSYTEASVGVLNWDPKIDTWWKYRYDPFHFGTASISFNHSFDVIRGYDAITQIYKRSNFIEVTDLTLGHYYEIANGLYLDTDLSFAERRPLIGYNFWKTDNVFPNDEPSDFETYQALILDVSLSWTPKQKYMREPNRKIVLGSRWPTFTLYYQKGISDVFGSDVNHDYLSLSILQTFKIGTIGTSTYHLKAGTFLNTASLKDADQKYHRRSDPIWFSNPLNSFQGLDSSLPTQRIYYEAHFVHHDNSAILSKIPFMKKTRIGLVIGGGYLYVPEFDWHHYEVLIGLERNFKISKRRLRIGFYGILSGGNHISPRPTWKISFALQDKRNMKWNF
ncbi:MAG: DUF5686 family protein [Crocinitomicaceae bacterium]|nr:DUF5686 family protein [Crocinitomicaceae bacterium]